MKTRIKLTRPIIKIREEMETLVGEIAQIKNNQRLMTARMDEQLNAIKKSYESNLGELSKALDEKMEVARVWAEGTPPSSTPRNQNQRGGGFCFRVQGQGDIPENLGGTAMSNMVARQKGPGQNGGQPLR